jgi:hypothetical protein
VRGFLMAFLLDPVQEGFPVSSWRNRTVSSRIERG